MLRRFTWLVALAASLLLFLAPAALAAEQTNTLIGANLLSKNQSDVETDLSGLDAASTSGQHALARDTSPGQAWQGSAAAKVTSNYAGSQTLTLTFAPGRVAVVPGQTYTASAYVKASTLMRQGLVAIRWLDANGATLADTRGTATSLGLTYSRLAVTGTAPARAAYAYLYLEFPSAQNGNSYWVDGAQFEAGNSPSAWVAGGSNYTVSVRGNYGSGYSNTYNTNGNPYPIRRVRVRAVARPSAPGSATSNDQVRLEYRTCSSCSFSAAKTWTALSVDEVVDLSATTAVEVRLYAYNGSSTVSGVSTTAWLQEVVVDGPPWTPPLLGITTAGPVLTHSWDGYYSWTSGEFVGSGRILGARVQVSRLYGNGYLEGWDGSTWRTLASYGYVSGTADNWVDLRSYTITKLRVRMSNVGTGYGSAPVVRVPEVYYTWGTPTPVNFDPTAVAVQTSGTVTIGAMTYTQPAGTVYELWRETLDTSGQVVRDELVAQDTYPLLATGAQTPGTAYRYRLRARYNGVTSDFSAPRAYYVPPAPATVTEAVGVLQVTWGQVAGSPALRVHASTDGWSWQGKTQGTGDATLTLSPMAKYQVGLAQAPGTLNPADASQVITDGQWYSPLWPAFRSFVESGGTPTSTTLYWRLDDVGVDPDAVVEIWRDGQLLWTGTSRSAGYAYRSVDGVSGYWAYLAQPGLVTGQTYTYEICARNAKGVCGPRASLMVRRMPNTPGQPVFDSTQQALHQVRMTWSNSGNPAGSTVEVWRRTYDGQGNVVADEKICNGTDLTACTTTTNQAGKLYSYRVRVYIGTVPSQDSPEAFYWTAPVPVATAATNALNLTWDPLPSLVLRWPGLVSSETTSWVYQSVAPPMPAQSGAVTVQGEQGDWVTVTYTCGSSTYTALSSRQISASSQTFTLNFTSCSATSVRVGVRKNAAGPPVTASLQVQVNAPALTVLYSSTGTSWSTYTTTTQTSATIPAPSPLSLSPSVKYQVALRIASQPDGGPTYVVTDGQWYAPTYRAPVQVNAATVQADSIQIWWTTGAYSSSAAMPNAAQVVIQRDGQTVATFAPSYSLSTRFGRYDYWASWTDSGLQPGTTYTYTICGVNSLGVCGETASLTVTTLPDAPAAVQASYGSYGWKNTAAGGAWAEVVWSPVQSATSYKIYLTGAETRTIPVGNVTRYRIPDLRSGGTYNLTVSALNVTGEGAQSQPVTFSTPNRADGTAPTGGTITLNDGAPTTGGGRVRVRVKATDTLSGVAGFQLSNNGTTWSPTYPVMPPGSNLIVLAGANAFFSDLAGWVAQPGTVWATVRPDQAAEQGGSVVDIRWDGGLGDRQQGLALATDAPVTAGKAYTIALRYKTVGLTAGAAGVWAQWKDGSGAPIGAPVTCALTAATTWATRNCVALAPANATALSLVLGFDQASTGALLTVDWIVLNEGGVPVAPTNTLNPDATGEVQDWQLDTSSYGQKTVYARFVDYAGNVSQPVSDKIQYILTDTTAPRVTAFTINGGAQVTNSTTVTLQLDAVDDTTPQAMLKVRFSNDGRVWSDWEPFAPSKTWNLCGQQQPVECQGQRTVWVEVQDAAGLTGGATASVFYRMDTTPRADPTVLAAATGTPGTFYLGATPVPVQFVRATTVTVNVAVAQLTGVRQVRYGLGDRWSAWEALAPQRTLDLPRVEGLQTLLLQTDDGRLYKLDFLLDLTPPAVTAGWKGGATVTGPGGTATLVLEAQDNLANPEDLQVSINGGPYQPWAPEIPLTLTGTGPATVTVRVRDPAGNLTVRQLTIYVLP